MALTYKQSTPFGSLTSSVVGRLIVLQNDINRIMNVANSLTGSGVNPAAIENDAYFGVGTAQGSPFYTALQTIQTGLNGISAANTLAQLDQGG